MFITVQPDPNWQLSFAQLSPSLFQLFLTLFSGISQGCISHSQPYLVYIFVINKACFRSISTIFQAYLRYLLSISYLGHLLSIFLEYLRHILGITQRFKCVVTNDKIQLIPSLLTFNI